MFTTWFHQLWIINHLCYHLQEKERHTVNTLTDSSLLPSQWRKNSVKPCVFQSMFTAKWWLWMMPTSLWAVLTSIRDQWQVWYFWRFLELFGYLLAIFEYYFWLCFLAVLTSIRDPWQVWCFFGEIWYLFLAIFNDFWLICSREFFAIMMIVDDARVPTK